MDERLTRAIEILRQSVRPGAQVQQQQETTTMNATYTRLSTGEWGLRSTSPLATGQQVTVTTRDGRRKIETVGAIVFSNAGVTVAAKATVRGHDEVPVNVPVPAPMPPASAPVAVPNGDALARIILDLETALAGLKALQRAA